MKRDKHLPRRSGGQTAPAIGNPVSWLMCYSAGPAEKVFARKIVPLLCTCVCAWRTCYHSKPSLVLSCLFGTLSFWLHPASAPAPGPPPAPLSTVVCLGRVIKRLNNASCLIIIYDTLGFGSPDYCTKKLLL